MFVQIASQNCLTVMVIALLTLNITVTSQEVKIEPIRYASLLPNTFTEGGYRVSHSAGTCTSGRSSIDSRTVPIINCSRGEGVLLDRISQPNINRVLTGEAIQAFSTWTDGLSELNHTFITLQFSDEPIITRAVVYCLVLQGLKIREPKKFQLFTSTTETVYPVTEIVGVNDPEFTMLNTGSTIIRRRSGDDDDDDDDDDNDNTISSNYEYRKYDISIPSNRQIPLNFLRISMDFSSDNWIFISEVETYRIEQQLNPTTSANGEETTASVQVTRVSTFSNASKTINVISNEMSTADPLTSMTSMTTAMSTTSTVSMTSAVSITTVASMTTAADISTGIKGPSTTTIPSPTTLEQTAKSSNNLLIFVIATVAAVASISLLLCIIILICVITCLRKKRNSLLVSNENIIPSVLHAYETVDSCKCSVENIYEKVNTTDFSAREQQKIVPPVPPPFPKNLKVPTVNSKQTKPKNIYYDDSALGFELGVYDVIPELELDIYDDVVQNGDAVDTELQEYLCDDIYCEAFDCNHPDSVYSDSGNALSLCVPIYNEPTPLKRNEAPKLVEWSTINVLKRLGEGQFGEVFLAETAEMGPTEPKTLVAIKTLKGDHSPTMKQEFEKEIKFMTRLKNAYVVQLLGICNKGTPFIMMEYMRNGDLHMFLNKHYLPELGKDTAEAVTPITIRTLQYVGLQIANGMRYLASHSFIHRDLAARNCLVGEDYIVKIADFGMTHNLYNEAYFVMRGKAVLPIRWMAPESFFGRFSTKTDVWSYGITLWEIFTLCRSQPYQEMTDEQLIMGVQKGDRKILPNRPPHIPDKVYDIMAKCWIYNPTLRPDFGTVYNQLLDYYTLSYEC